MLACQIVQAEGRLQALYLVLPPMLASAPVGLSQFSLDSGLNGSVAESLQGVSPITYVLVLAAGLASSLSPCTLSVMPLTIGAPRCPCCLLRKQFFHSLRAAVF